LVVVACVKCGFCISHPEAPLRTGARQPMPRARMGSASPLPGLHASSRHKSHKNTLRLAARRHSRLANSQPQPFHQLYSGLMVRGGTDISISRTNMGSLGRCMRYMRCMLVCSERGGQGDRTGGKIMSGFCVWDGFCTEGFDGWGSVVSVTKGWKKMFWACTAEISTRAPATAARSRSGASGATVTTKRSRKGYARTS